MEKKVEDILKRLPKSPGIYQMKNSKGKIIYIGKSLNLKNRVSSYFNGKSKLNFAKQKMVSLVHDIELIETKNEMEALVLETNLIKKHKPKYNIMMKDDKNLSYIKISNDIIPEVTRTRIKTSSGEYFGPYPSVVNIASILDILKKIFKIRSCKAKFTTLPNGKLLVTGLSGRSIPCLDFHIGLCPAPCILGEKEIDEYKKNIDLLRNFLRGHTGEIVKNLEQKMLEKAKNAEFEEAGKLRDQIKNIKELAEKQLARDSIPGNNDVIVTLSKYSKLFVGLTEIRNSEIDSVIFTKIENEFEEPTEDIFLKYLQQRYINDESGNLTIITNEIIEDKAILEYLKMKKIKIESPSIGQKIDIINFTKNNLLNYAYKEELNEISKRTLTKQTQKNILKALGFEMPEKKELIFECFDISHLGGTNTVASKSVIIDGKSVSSRYKKYKLKTIATGEIDDFKSMGEIMERRMQEAIKLNNMPDLIIIDGGKGQLSSAINAIEHILSACPDIKFPNICSIAKREEELFVQNKSEPIILEKGTPELALIQKIRDEAHRFAINFNREKRIKEMKKNILEEIPGLGPKSRQKLLKLAGSVDNIKNIPKEDILKIINKNHYEKLEEYGIV